MKLARILLVGAALTYGGCGSDPDATEPDGPDPSEFEHLFQDEGKADLGPGLTDMGRLLYKQAVNVQFNAGETHGYLFQGKRGDQVGLFAGVFPNSGFSSN